MTEKTRSLLLPMAIILLGVVTYANSLTGQFVWDDKFLISGNKHIRSPAYIGNIFREDLFYMSDLPTGYYRPMQTLSYMADHILWGTMPLGYHLTNLAIQIANALLVMFLCFLITGDRIKSFLVAAIFCVHPAFVPIVGYISGRADLLGMFFSLPAIYLVIRCAMRGKGGVIYWLAVPLYGLAVISKEFYILTPLFALLYLFLTDRKADGQKPDHQANMILAAMLCVALIYIVLRATVLNFHQSMGDIADQAFLTRLAVFPWILKNYVVMLLLPIGLSMEKWLVYERLLEPRFVVSYIIPLSIAWLWYYLRKRKQGFGLFWLGWFLLGIVSVSNLIIPLKAVWADHWAYMASIGFFALLISIPNIVPAMKTAGTMAKKILSGAVCVFIIFLVAMTMRENRYWHSGEALYTRILEKNPHSARTVFNQGKLCEERGDLKKALELFDRAISDDGPNPEAQYLNSRGMVHKNLGDKMKALADFEAAARRAPSVALYHNNLGCIYADLDRIDDARREWKRTLEISPTDELAGKNLGIIGDK